MATNAAPGLVSHRRGKRQPRDQARRLEHGQRCAPAHPRRHLLRRAENPRRGAERRRPAPVHRLAGRPRRAARPGRAPRSPRAAGRGRGPGCARQGARVALAPRPASASARARTVTSARRSRPPAASASSTCGSARSARTTRSSSCSATPGRPELDVAFVGGIDLCHSRRDDASHPGDPQGQPMAAVYGPRPPWHDIQLAIRGPAVADVETVFRERWEDPHPLTRNPFRRLRDRLRARTTPPARCPPRDPDPPPARHARRAGPAHLPAPAHAATRSRRTASAASRAPTTRRSGGRARSSTWRTSTSGPRMWSARSPTRCAPNPSCG